MQTYSHQVSFAIIILSIVFVLLALLVGIILLLHNQKVKRMDIEQKVMRQEFNQTLLQTQLEIQEQTFNYISQEIHDNVGQVLSLAKVQANIMGQSDVGGKMLTPLKENIDKALADLRNIAKSLSSERIRALGLYEATAVEAERISKSGILHLHCSLQGQEREISEQQKLILFRIVQEGLQNCIKHASASSASILFCYLPNEMTVTIIDNGKGFDLQKKLEQKSGLGLQNMSSRAALIGGSCTIASSQASGTSIRINLPYNTA